MSAQPFSASYAQAREKFLEAVSAAGLQPESHIHPFKGRDGETLAMDLAWVGDPKADRLQGRPDASADQWLELTDALDEAPIIYEFDIVRTERALNPQLTKKIETEGVTIYTAAHQVF